MKSPLMTPTFDSASRLARAREGSQFGLAAKALAVCNLLLGLNPFVSWSSKLVEMNLASVEVMAESLQGIGFAKAHRIVDYWEANGPFEHSDELAPVQGIGSATVEKNRSVIRLQ